MARLRRSAVDAPGIRRRRRGRGFSYSWDEGGAITDAELLERIRALAIPPAWTDVWICPWSNGHIQAIGTDAAGRRQYRYHDKWREQRDHEKFERTLEFGRRVRLLRARVTDDLDQRSLGRERVLAAAVRLLDTSSLRIGGKEYTEDNETYGLTTLRKRHARLERELIVLTFTAKSNRRVQVEVRDQAASAVLRALKTRRDGGPNLFAWRRSGNWTEVAASHVNDYIKEAIGTEFSAKDFRTWNATVLAATRFADVTTPSGSPRSRRAVSAVVTAVAEHLGNTPAVCRSAYVDPRVVECFQRGETIGDLTRFHKREAIERAVVAMLDGSGSRGSEPVRRHAA